MSALGYSSCKLVFPAPWFSCSPSKSAVLQFNDVSSAPASLCSNSERTSALHLCSVRVCCVMQQTRRHWARLHFAHDAKDSPHSTSCVHINMQNAVNAALAATLSPKPSKKTQNSSHETSGELVPSQQHFKPFLFCCKWRHVRHKQRAARAMSRLLQALTAVDTAIHFDSKHT